MKHKLVVADLGAAGNLVKNLILLSPDIHWPMEKDRYLTILNQYSTEVNFARWLSTEYQLRFWKYYYQVDLADNLDYDIYVKSSLPKKPVVFLNHSAFYQPEQFDKFKTSLDIIYIAPDTIFGLEWQIRSYCEKRSVSLLHDFSFDSDKTNQKKNYMQKYGEESYYRMNITNMKEIIGHRQQLFKVDFSLENTIKLEDLLYGKVDTVVDKLSRALSISLSYNQADNVIKAWQNLHWPLEKTSDWKYHDCIA